MPLTTNMFVFKYSDLSLKDNFLLGFRIEEFVVKVNIINDDNYSSPNTTSDDRNSSLIRTNRRNILLTCSLAGQLATKAFVVKRY